MQKPRFRKERGFLFALANGSSSCIKKKEGLRIDGRTREIQMEKVVGILAHRDSGKLAASTLSAFTASFEVCRDAVIAAAQREHDPVPDAEDFETCVITPRNAVLQALKKPLHGARAIIFVAHGHDLEWVESIGKIVGNTPLLQSVRWAGIIVHGAPVVYEHPALSALASLNQAGVAILPRGVACSGNERDRESLKTLGSELVRALYAYQEWDSSGSRTLQKRREAA